MIPHSRRAHAMLRHARRRSAGARIALVLVLALVASIPAQSQMVRGTVRDAAGLHVAGALVELRRGDRHVTRVLADGEGRYRLFAPNGGRFHVRVLRVGYRAMPAVPIDVPAAGTLVHDLTAPMVVVRLRDVDVRADMRCIVRPEEGALAARLWEEARKALYATEIVQSAANGYAARMRNYERDYARDLQRITADTQWIVSATVRKNPYSAISADALADGGYFRTDSSGDNAVTTYYAPDAHVLVGERFTATHCFRADARSRAAEGLIGLEFEPVEGRELPDVRGTLWLDRESAELRSLDYRYTELPRGLASDRSGGHLEFQRLPNGLWIVRSWWIRMPVFLTVRRPALGNHLPGGAAIHREWRTQSLTGFRERGAEVILAENSQKMQLTEAAVPPR
jgi:hypothetical protein